MKFPLTRRNGRQQYANVLIRADFCAEREIADAGNSYMPLILLMNIAFPSKAISHRTVFLSPSYGSDP